MLPFSGFQTQTGQCDVISLRAILAIHCFSLITTIVMKRTNIYGGKGHIFFNAIYIMESHKDTSTTTLHDMAKITSNTN